LREGIAVLLGSGGTPYVYAKRQLQHALLAAEKDIPESIIPESIKMERSIFVITESSTNLGR